MKNIIKNNKLIIFSILITLLIEIFICNYGYFRTLIRGNNNIKPEYIHANNVILIPNINERITSIKINYKNKLKNTITYNLSYTAEENSDNIHLNSKSLLKYNKHYINFDTHSKCKSIKIDLFTINENIEIDSIILNHPNMNISIIRIIILFITIIFISKIKNKSIYQKKYNKNNKEQDNIFKINLSIFISFIFLYILCQLPPGNVFIEKENINKEDSILMQTEAIMNGQIPYLKD